MLLPSTFSIFENLADDPRCPIVDNNKNQQFANTVYGGYGVVQAYAPSVAEIDAPQPAVPFLVGQHLSTAKHSSWREVSSMNIRPGTYKREDTSEVI